MSSSRCVPFRGVRDQSDGVRGSLAGGDLNSQLKQQGAHSDQQEGVRVHPLAVLLQDVSCSTWAERSHAATVPVSSTSRAVPIQGSVRACPSLFPCGTCSSAAVQLGRRSVGGRETPAVPSSCFHGRGSSLDHAKLFRVQEGVRVTKACPRCLPPEDVPRQSGRRSMGGRKTPEAPSPLNPRDVNGDVSRGSPFTGVLRLGSRGRRHQRMSTRSQAETHRCDG